MIEIPQELVEKVLAIYKPEQRLLKKASLEYPLASGNFLIGPTYYTLKRLEHATDIEIQLCLNQLIYVSVAEEFKIGSNPYFKGLNFFELYEKNMFVIESKKRFRRHIPTDKHINGEIKTTKEKKVRNLIIRNIDFQFENSSCTGNLELALVLPAI